MNTETLPQEDPIQTPAEFLRAIFLQKKARNASYSTRSFARDIGMSQSLLSRVLNGKRPLTLKQAMQISVLLGLSQDEGIRFIETAYLCLPKNSKGHRKLRQIRATSRTVASAIHVNYDVERFKALSHWYHVAILDLCSVRGFRCDPTWVSKRLGISSLEARDALSRLERLGLLEERKGKVRKTEKNIFFQTSRSEPSIRNFHKQMIGKAIDQLDRTSDQAFAARKISSITLTLPLSRLEEAKAEVDAFQKTFASKFVQTVGDEVYQLNVQLFPLTQSLSEKKV